MKSKSKAVALLQSATLGAFVLTTASVRPLLAGQEQSTGSRQIVAEEFTKERPATSPPATPQPRRGKTNGNSPARPAQSINGTVSNAPHRARRRVYRRASAKPIETSASPSGGALEVAQLGLTLWRLRPSMETDRGARLLEQESASAGDEREWTPERVEAESQLRIGDRLRLSIESPRTGYLYVIDREQYSDGTLGDPYLIFPTLRTRGGDNQVRAGRLIEIPSQEDSPPYFKLTRSRENQTGEVLTVIVTPRPIEELSIERNRLKLTSEQVVRWEKMWGVSAERFEMDGGAGTAWTKEEQGAGATMGRSLTQEEPGPQTIYRVAVKSGTPLLITVALGYGSR